MARVGDGMDMDVGEAWAESSGVEKIWVGAQDSKEVISDRIKPLNLRGKVRRHGKMGEPALFTWFFVLFLNTLIFQKHYPSHINEETADPKA